MSASLFAAVEMAPRDPILGLNEQFAADPNPAKVNLGVGVYFDESGKLPLLACVAAAEKQLIEAPKATRLPADRRHRGLRQGGPGPGLRRRQRGGQERPHRHRAGARRHRRPQGRRRLPEAAEPGRDGADQRPELGEPPRAVRQRRLRGRHLPLLRRRDPGGRLRRDARRAERGRAGHDRRAARLLPQPDRLRPDARAVDARSSAACKARELVPFLDMAYQGFGEGIEEDGAVVSSSSPPASTSSSRPRSRRASRSTASASARSASSAPSQDECARVLSQLKIVIRTNYSNPPTHGAAGRRHGADDAGAARAVGTELAGMRERIKRDARTRWSPSCRPRA